MSDRNLQPWKIEFENCMVKLKFHEIQCQKPHLNCIGVGDTKIETCTCMNSDTLKEALLGWVYMLFVWFWKQVLSLLENIEHYVAEFCYCFPPFMSQFRWCPMSLFYFLYVAISRHCRLLEFTLTGTLKRDCTIIVQSWRMAACKYLNIPCSQNLAELLYLCYKNCFESQQHSGVWNMAMQRISTSFS